MTGCVCVRSGALGVALSGGGARALAQLGVLKVLDREGVPVSYVAGTSGGAIIGALYVASESALEAESRILDHLGTTGTGFNAETYERLSGQESGRIAHTVAAPREGLRLLKPGGSLIDGAAMRGSLRGLLGDATFADTRVPFAATALDLASGRRVIFAGGDLADAVYASSAIPGVFEPLVFGERMFVDGGWVEPVPVSTVRHLGAIHALAVSVTAAEKGADSDEPPGAVAVALRADSHARAILERTQLSQADFVVRAPTDVAHFGDFSDPAATIRAGLTAAEAEIDGVLSVLERHDALFVVGAGDWRAVGRVGRDIGKPWAAERS